MATRKPPRFKSEAQEAEWWAKNQDYIADRFEQAKAAILQCDADKVRPAVMMMEVYRRILEKLSHRGWLNLNLSVAISGPGKLWIALRYGFFP